MNCPNFGVNGNKKYVHDFGSILNFIEYAFGQNKHPLGWPYGISAVQGWPYADYFAPDYNPQQQGSYSLSDFFIYSQPNPQPIPFRQVLGAKYGETCFHQPDQTGCFPNSYYPIDPDNDAIESD